MDGLLLDTEPLWLDAERDILRRHGHAFTEADRQASHGRAVGDSAAAYAPRLGLSAETIEREILDAMLAHYVAGPPLHAGVRELIEALDGAMALAVASNTTAPLVRRALTSAGLQALQVVASGADMGRPKPLPDVYLEACRLLGVAPHEAVAFEDSPMGIRAAVEAGLFAVGVPDREGVDLVAAGADVVVGSLTEIVVRP